MTPYLKMITAHITKIFYQHIISLIIFGIVAAITIYIIEKIGLRNFLIEIKNKFLKEAEYKWKILFFTYLYFIIDKSLLSRSRGMINNLEFAFKRDWLFLVKDTWSKVQASENIIFFIPFSFFMFLGFFKDMEIKVIKKIIGICFALSLIIESIQLITTLGTFQLSDIFYNVLGGIFGVTFAILFR